MFSREAVPYREERGLRSLADPGFGPSLGTCWLYDLNIFCYPLTLLYFSSQHLSPSAKLYIHFNNVLSVSKFPELAPRKQGLCLF